MLDGIVLLNLEAVRRVQDINVSLKIDICTRLKHQDIKVF